MWVKRNMSCSAPFRTPCGSSSDYAPDGFRGSPERHRPARERPGHNRPGGPLVMRRLTPKCDPSDTANSQNHEPSLLRLIHEIERLDLVRVSYEHPARWRLATGLILGAGLGHEPSAGG